MGQVEEGAKWGREGRSGERKEGEESVGEVGSWVVAYINGKENPEKVWRMANMGIATGF